MLGAIVGGVGGSVYEHQNYAAKDLKALLAENVVSTDACTSPCEWRVRSGEDTLRLGVPSAT